MIDSPHLWLQDTQNTRFCGCSLASTLYTQPVDILLSGPLGAGKTTFVQGLAEGLGIRDYVSSPTYALEQRYKTDRGTEFLHLDLYRIAPDRIAETLAASEDHTGIRCIEWADRMQNNHRSDIPSITIALAEEKNGRNASIEFDDVPLPSQEQIHQWQNDVRLPAHIIAHCNAVADFAVRCAHMLIETGRIVRPLALRRAGELHDLLRFIDFRPGAAPAEHTDDPASIAVWEEWKQRYASMHHEEACATFLREHGYDALATIIEPHGLQLPSPPRVTVEQQLLFYADKRVNVDHVVSIDKRFDDFARRYGEGVHTERANIWSAEAKAVEKQLFPHGAPQ